MNWIYEDWRWLRLILLLLFLVMPLCWSLPDIDTIRNGYQVSVPPTSKESAQAGPNPAGETQSSPMPVPEPLSQQNKQMIDWGILLLGSIIALVTITKVHKIERCEWLFLIVALAALR